MFQFYPKYTHKFNGGKELVAGAVYQFFGYNDETDGLRRRIWARYFQNLLRCNFAKLFSKMVDSITIILRK